jgi:hypothetical protein
MLTVRVSDEIIRELDMLGASRNMTRTETLEHLFGVGGLKKEDNDEYHLNLCQRLVYRANKTLRETHQAMKTFIAPDNYEDEPWRTVQIKSVLSVGTEKTVGLEEMIKTIVFELGGVVFQTQYLLVDVPPRRQE